MNNILKFRERLDVLESYMSDSQREGHENFELRCQEVEDLIEKLRGDLDG